MDKLFYIKRESNWQWLVKNDIKRAYIYTVKLSVFTVYLFYPVKTILISSLVTFRDAYRCFQQPICFIVRQWGALFIWLQVILILNATKWLQFGTVLSKPSKCIQIICLWNLNSHLSCWKKICYKRSDIGIFRTIEKNLN